MLVLLKLCTSQKLYIRQFKFDKRFLIQPVVENEIKDKIIFKRRDISANGELNLSFKLRVCKRALSRWKKGSSMPNRVQLLEKSLE